MVTDRKSLFAGVSSVIGFTVFAAVSFSVFISGTTVAFTTVDSFAAAIAVVAVTVFVAFFKARTTVGVIVSGTVIITTTAAVISPVTVSVIETGTATASLRRSKVLTRRGSARSLALGFFNGEGSSRKKEPVKRRNGTISASNVQHVDKAKASRFLGMGINHDLALVNNTVFRENLGQFRLGDSLGEASNKEVGTLILCVLLSLHARKRKS